MTKRKTWLFRQGNVMYREESHDGRYGAPGKKRGKKTKPTPEQVQANNARLKTRRCRFYLLEYFDAGDLFVTLTYNPENRPETMEAAKKDLRMFCQSVRRVYKKRECPFMWISNIEQGTRGAWHIHFVVKQTPQRDAAAIVQKAWKHGGIYTMQISLSNKLFDEDFSKLSAYMTKDEHTREEKKDGTLEKPKIAQSCWSHSRNMPLPEPKDKELVRWSREPKIPKGYYLIDAYEGTNPITGFPFRRYTMIRLEKKGTG